MTTFDDPRMTTVGLFIEAGVALQRRMGEVAGSHGISGVDLDTLLRLARSTGGRLLVSDLTAQSGHPGQDVEGILAGLEARGLARVTLDGDGRHVAAISVDGGIVLTETIEGALGVIDATVLPALGEDRVTVEMALRRVRNAVHPTATADSR